MIQNNLPQLYRGTPCSISHHSDTVELLRPLLLELASKQSIIIDTLTFSQPAVQIKPGHGYDAHCTCDGLPFIGMGDHSRLFSVSHVTLFCWTQYMQVHIVMLVSDWLSLVKIAGRIS